MTLQEYWLERAAHHVNDTYAGVQLMKFPEDLRVYEHLLWESRANVVIELGTAFGASALWFRDRLRTLQSHGRIAIPLVITIDRDLSRSREALRSRDGIVALEADATDPGLPDTVAALLPADASCFVVEDSAHVYETTRAALEGLAPFVAPGGFFVVEDTCVDFEQMRVRPDWPRGVLPAVTDWLETPAGRDFRVRRDLEMYGLSCHPSGFLQRSPRSE